MKLWVCPSSPAPIDLWVNTIQLYLSAIFFAFSYNFFFSEGRTCGIGRPRVLASCSNTCCLFSNRNNSCIVINILLSFGVCYNNLLCYNRAWLPGVLCMVLSWQIHRNLKGSFYWVHHPCPWPSCWERLRWHPWGQSCFCTSWIGLGRHPSLGHLIK